MYSVSQLLDEVKQQIAAWLAGGGEAAVPRSRRCRRCGAYRHRHGSYTRQLKVGKEKIRLDILRVYCPKCGTTEAVLPAFVVRHSRYPAGWKEAAIWAYVTGSRGYRPVAAAFHVSWELLWAWTERVAGIAKDTLVQIEALLLRYEPSTAASQPRIEAGRACRPGKDEQLACVRELFIQALRLWELGRARGQPWGPPSPEHLLAFIESCAGVLV
jgi:hypothetical protein